MNRTLVVTSTVVVLLVALLGVGAYAFAQTDGGPPWRDGVGWHDGDRGWGGWRHRGPDPDRVREIRAGLAADLAAELDASPEEVEAAFRALAAQRLEEAAAAGEIDEATVDEALAAYDEGDVGALFHTIKEAPDETTESR